MKWNGFDYFSSSQSYRGKKWPIQNRNLRRQSGQTLPWCDAPVCHCLCLTQCIESSLLQQIVFQTVVQNSSPVTFLVYDLAFGFLIHCECSRAKSSPANPFKIPQLHRPSSRFLSPLILHSRWQGCWSPSQQSWAKRQSYSLLNVHVIGRWREPEAPPSLHLQRRRDSNSTRRGSREWNLQPLQISAAFVVVHFSERDRAAGCGWADAVWAQHLSAAICIALTFICSFGTDMNVFTGAVTQPLQSAPMCRQITSIKELLCCVAADPCCLLLLFCSGESVVSQQCSLLVATIRRNRVSKNREQDVNLLSSVLSYIWVYENT